MSEFFGEAAGACLKFKIEPAMKTENTCKGSDATQNKACLVKRDKLGRPLSPSPN